MGSFLGSSRNYESLPGVKVRFPNGIPLDKPICGYTGELCIKGEVQVRHPVVPRYVQFVLI